MASFDVLGDLQLSPDGKRFVYLTGALALAQRIKVGFHTPLGSLVFNTALGFPWLRDFFGRKGTVASRIAVIRSYLAGFQEVQQVIVTETLDRKTRQVTYRYLLETTLGSIGDEITFEPSEA